VPQPPERCLSRKAGIVRCCHKEDKLKSGLCRKARPWLFRWWLGWGGIFGGKWVPAGRCEQRPLQMFFRLAAGNHSL